MIELTKDIELLRAWLNKLDEEKEIWGRTEAGAKRWIDAQATALTRLGQLERMIP